MPIIFALLFLGLAILVLAFVVVYIFSLTILAIVAGGGLYYVNKILPEEIRQKTAELDTEIRRLRIELTEAGLRPVPALPSREEFERELRAACSAFTA
jgi:hypothetical protein